VIPWSYSFLRDLANCPHKAMRRYVKRDLPRETSPELEEGYRVHKLFEDRINGQGKLPPELEAHAAPLVGPQTRAEYSLGMTKDFYPAPFWDDRRTGEQPWGRGKIDVIVFKPPQAFIVDWKTGKVREDPRELFIQSLLLRVNYPEINMVSGCYVWLKEGKMGKLHDLTDINSTYQETAKAMERAQGYEAAGDWPKTPNPLCGWCNVKDCENNRNTKL